MKNSIILKMTFVGVLFAVAASNAFGWGQKGHDVTCAIAEKHLSKKACRKISEALNGKSIVYWANWLDNASHTPEFDYTRTWHFKNIEDGQAYEEAVLCETGDVVTAINAQIEALKSGTLNKRAEALALKILVHLMGDLHCPMHISHKADLGGNRWQVQYFRNGTNLHKVWDSAIVEDAHKWTYSEWVEQIDITDRKEVERIAAGTPDDWAKETLKISNDIYKLTPIGAKLSYDYVNIWAPVVEAQFVKGGLRLASILNDIYR